MAEPTGTGVYETSGGATYELTPAEVQLRQDVADQTAVADASTGVFETSDGATYELTPAEIELRKEADAATAEADSGTVAQRDETAEQDKQDRAVAVSKQLGAVLLDVVVKESHRARLNIARNPVEKGADVTDHAYVEPRKLTLEAVIGGKGTVATGQTPAQARSVVAGKEATASPQTQVQAAWKALTDLQATRKPFDVVTRLQLYRNMLIEELSCDLDKDRSNVLWFEASLSEVILVSTETTAGSLGKGRDKLKGKKTKDRGAGTVQRGNGGAVPAATDGKSAEGKKNRSVLKDVVFGFGS